RHNGRADPRTKEFAGVLSLASSKTDWILCRALCPVSGGACAASASLPAGPHLCQRYNPPRALTSLVASLLMRTRAPHCRVWPQLHTTHQPFLGGECKDGRQRLHADQELGPHRVLRRQRTAGGAVLRYHLWLYACGLCWSGDWPA